MHKQTPKEPVYRKSQISWLMIVVFSLILGIISVSYFVQAGRNPLDEVSFSVLAGFLLLLLLCFYKLTIVVDNRRIQIIYGIGIIRISIRPEALRTVEIVKTSMLAGWGIRITADGMLYNIQGRQAVRMQYGKEKLKTVRIGTAQPQALSEAITAAFLARKTDKEE